MNHHIDIPETIILDELQKDQQSLIIEGNLGNKRVYQIKSYNSMREQQVYRLTIQNIDDAIVTDSITIDGIPSIQSAEYLAAEINKALISSQDYSQVIGKLYSHVMETEPLEVVELSSSFVRSLGNSTSLE